MSIGRARPFNDRVKTHSLTPEWVESYAGIDDDAKARKRIEEAAGRFEDSYNAVAAVGEKSHLHGWTVHVIPARNADMDEIRRGMRSLMYWVAEGDDAS